MEPTSNRPERILQKSTDRSGASSRGGQRGYAVVTNGSVIGKNGVPTQADRKLLNSWKEIATRLGRGVRTVQRYEQQLGLPVRRPAGRDRSAVMAFSDELDEWLNRAPKKKYPNSLPDVNDGDSFNPERGAVAQSRNLELLESVVTTPELWRRPSHETEPDKLKAELRRLTKHLQSDELALLNALLEAAINLCRADSAGFITLYRKDNGEEFFRWDAVAGALKYAVGGTTPRNWSPCGLTLDRESPQLVSYPARCFESLREAKPDIVEGLVLPVYLDQRQPLGTLWIVAHNETRKFDAEDVRIMNSLAHFCAAAIRLIRQQPATSASAMQA